MGGRVSSLPERTRMIAGYAPAGCRSSQGGGEPALTGLLVSVDSLTVSFPFMRFSLPRLPLLFGFLLAVSQPGCATKDGGSRWGPGSKSEGETEKTGGLFSQKEGKPSRKGLFGKKEDGAESEKEIEPDRPMIEPQKLPIGNVHLVHDTGGFVLIQSSRLANISPEAELFTYNLAGRPTGKLKISPERKGSFLTADIIQGNPSAGDRVLMFSYLDETGEMRFGDRDPDAVEVLE